MDRHRSTCISATEDSYFVVACTHHHALLKLHCLIASVVNIRKEDIYIVSPGYCSHAQISRKVARYPPIIFRNIEKVLAMYVLTEERFYKSV